ncbi:Recombination protein RecR [Geodia barretti]|uniref:Recombination protein RecR n=2 Tax=Geodia barretti TaxID=519541 RepID=A0AA35WDB3_GEOBA|nr:Recombination protein RecR [Geodia barretti]
MLNDPGPGTTRSLGQLISELHRLPGIGPKSAQRIAYHIAQMPAEDARTLTDAITSVKDLILFCAECRNLTDASPCDICSNPQRNQDQICVVEESRDLVALERTRAFRGLYHVLHGVLSPLNGIGPEDIHLPQLFGRLQREDNPFRELIIATNSTLEGDATADFIHRRLNGSGIRITRLARGLPVGGTLEFADELTLSRAFSGRSELE